MEFYLDLLELFMDLDLDLICYGFRFGYGFIFSHGLDWSLDLEFSTHSTALITTMSKVVYTVQTLKFASSKVWTIEVIYYTTSSDEDFKNFKIEITLKSWVTISISSTIPYKLQFCLQAKLMLL